MSRKPVIVNFDTTMSDTTPWEEYCEASLDLSNQDNVGDPQAPLDPLKISMLKLYKKNL